MNFYRAPAKLEDCAVHGHDSGAELFIVEGDSAARAVAALRNPQFQAVLPMQGKPLNAMKARRAAIDKNPFFQAIFESLGYGERRAQVEHHIAPEECRYERVILLFDPDADGIHCGALLLMFFYRLLRPLLEHGTVCLVRAPLFELTLEHSDGTREPTRYAYTEEHALKLIQDLEFLGIRVHRQRYRGLANMKDHTLYTTCLNPESRVMHRTRAEDAEAAIAMFGG